ncbi:unnamed protein product [[Candida] boidinii]|uniref:chitinase n=1 Tax=Candida boidinii TaxID=5477 RepID=A0A9W6T0K6_CANBO|nr:hypothetical protein B5S33_g3573 [[Candida] boidinii]GME72471.1 unnamed protein product [[Candida] boidinii]
MSCQSLLFSFIFSILFSSLTTAFDINSKENVVVYWGQNSAGSQQRLSHYCESDSVDVVILSFMSAFSNADTLPTLNFANACETTFSDGLLQCDTIAADIQTCQANGKKVLLSLGGASGAYGFASDAVAEGFAETLWNMFGAGSAVERPFGNAVLDGFDFDIENNIPVGYAALATKLREYYAQDSSKTYYISASPQCVYPDASVGDLLANADVDFAFIQFYNNYCNTDRQFNWNTWAEFATSSSPNKDIKLYLGLPGSPTAAGSGYVTSDVVKNALANVIKSLDSNFGGISIWDASQAFANSVSGVNFAESMKSILAEVFGGQATSPTTSTSPVTPSTTSTTSTTPVAPTTTSTTSTTPVVPTTTSTTPVAPTTTSTTSTTPVAPTTTSTIPVAPTTTSTTSTTPVAPTTTSTIPVAPTTTSTTSTTPVAPTTTSTTSTTPVVPTTTSATTPNGKDVQLSFTKSISTSSSVVTTAITLNPTTTLATVTKTSSTSASTTSIPASATTTPASSSFKDCSSLTGKDKAVCLNTNFANNLFSSGSADSCNTEGEISCSGDGSFAICNFGKWVKMQCAAGTTCYAYTQNDQVDIGCNYSDQKSSFTKRNNYFYFF